MLMHAKIQKQAYTNKQTRPENHAHQLFVVRVQIVNAGRTAERGSPTVYGTTE